MSNNILVIFIIVIIFLIIIIEPVLYVKKIIKKGKKEKAKILKVEYERMMSAEIDDPLRHWFNLEIELRGEILKRQVAITDFTKELKVGDYINVIVYKSEFLLEEELDGYKNGKIND